MEQPIEEKRAIDLEQQLPPENFRTGIELGRDDPNEYEKGRTEIIRRGNGVIQVITEPEIIHSYPDENGFEVTELTGFRPVRDVRFILPDGTTFSFFSILPPTVQIFEKQGILIGSRAFFDPEQQRIVYSREKSARDQPGTESFFKPDGALFDLLHEIGHSHSVTSEKIVDWKLLFHEDINQEEHSAEKRIDLILQEERNAHAYALRKLLQIRKRGIDLEPNLETLGDLHRYIHGILAIEQKRRRILKTAH